MKPIDILKIKSEQCHPGRPFLSYPIERKIGKRKQLILLRISDLIVIVRKEF